MKHLIRRHIGRAVIWCVFAAMVVGGFAASNVSFVDGSLDAPTGATVQAAAPGVLPMTNPPTGDTYVTQQQALIAAQDVNEAGDLNLLPGYRWRDDVELTEACGWIDVLCGVGSFVGFALFGLAGFVWLILISVIGFAVTLTDVLNMRSAQTAVNNMFSFMADSVIGTGIVFIAAIFAVVAAGRMIMSGRSSGAFRTVLAAVLPVAALLAMTSAVNQETTSGSTYNSGSGPGEVPGSPLWLAQQGNSIVGDTIESVAAGLSGITPGLTVNTSDYADVTPSCTAYTDALYAAFDATPTAQNSGASSLVMVSRLWESSFLQSYQQAAYAGSQSGERIWCHHLEANAGTDRAEQATIGYLAGYPGYEVSSHDAIAGIIVDAGVSDTCPTAPLWGHGSSGVTQPMLLNPDGTAQNTASMIDCPASDSSNDEESDGNALSTVWGWFTGAAQGTWDATTGTVTCAANAANCVVEAGSGLIRAVNGSTVSACTVGITTNAGGCLTAVGGSLVSNMYQSDASYYDARQGRRDPYSATGSGGDEFQSSLLMWSACRYDANAADGTPKWQVQAAWVSLGAVSQNDCVAWWYTGVPADYANSANTKLVWDGVPSIGGSVAGTIISDPDQPSVVGNVAQVLTEQQAAAGNVVGETYLDDTSDVHALLRGVYGQNGGDRILAGIAAVVTAIMYLWALGGLAFGVVLAQIGFMVLLGLLPATLTFLAFESRKGSQNGIGRRLGKMTLAYGGATFVLGLLMLVLVYTMSVIAGIFTAFDGVWASMLLDLCVPIVSIMLVKRAARTVGMSGVMTRRGAVGLAAHAANPKSSKGIQTPAQRRAQKHKQEKDDIKSGKTTGVKAAMWNAKHAARTKASDHVKTATKNRVANAFTARTGMGFDEWADSMKQAGSRRRVMMSAAGAGDVLARHLERHNKAGLASKARQLGRKVTGFRPGRLNKYDAEFNRREQARRRAAAPSADAHFEEQRTRLAGLVAQERDRNGNPLFVNGEPVYGFAVTRPDGSITYTDADTVGFDPVTGMCADPNATVVTTPDMWLSPPERETIGQQTAVEWGMNRANIAIGAAGVAPTVIPASAKQTLPPPSMDSDALRRAADHGAFLINPRQWEVVADLAPEAQHQFITDWRIRNGLLDPDTGAEGSALTLIDIDPNMAGLDAELARWQNDDPKEPTSRIGSRTIDIPNAQFNQLLASAQRTDAAVRNESVTIKMADTLNAEVQRRAANSTADVHIVTTYADRVDTAFTIAQDAASATPAERDDLMIDLHRAVNEIVLPEIIETVENAHGSVVSIPEMVKLQAAVRVTDPYDATQVNDFVEKTSSLMEQAADAVDLSGIIGAPPESGDPQDIADWLGNIRSRLNREMVTPMDEAANSLSARIAAHNRKTGKRRSARDLFD